MLENFLLHLPTGAARRSRCVFYGRVCFHINTYHYVYGRFMTSSSVINGVPFIGTFYLDSYYIRDHILGSRHLVRYSAVITWSRRYGSWWGGHITRSKHDNNSNS